MKLDLDFLTRAYFYFDEPVPYVIDEQTIYINPVSVRDSEIFEASAPILTIEKNTLPSAEIISMPYLEFLYKLVFQEESQVDKLSNILKLSLGITSAKLGFNKQGKAIIYDQESNLIITSKHFDNIRRIIMYQNVPGYDDSYINPDLKKAMEETNAMKNKGVELPNIERRMAIVTAHCGISKKEQMEMTMRSHMLLFNEVAGEVEFTTIRPIALFGGKGNEIPHWIYQPKKDKFDGYISEVSKIKGKFGGKIEQSGSNELGNKYMEMYDNYKNK